MTVRLLESTQAIKAENLPDSISTDYLAVYFENTRNGGGPVSDVQLFPEEKSAIITFCDHKGNTVLCLTKVLTGRWPARKLLQMWALGEAWLSVAELNVHCPVPRRCSGCPGLQCLLGVCLLVCFVFYYQKYILIPALCMGFSHWYFFSICGGFYVQYKINRTYR